MPLKDSAEFSIKWAQEFIISSLYKFCLQSAKRFFVSLIIRLLHQKVVRIGPPHLSSGSNFILDLMSSPATQQAPWRAVRRWLRGLSPCRPCRLLPLQQAFDEYTVRLRCSSDRGDFDRHT